MANRSSSPNPRKNSDSPSLLSELAKVFGLKKVSRALTNNNKSSSTSSTNSKNSTDEDFSNKSSYDLKSINKYTFPSFNDDYEFERLNLEHYFFRFQWQSNFSSPIERKLLSGGVNVLDVGCGTGVWILDMAREFPLNTYIGIDILSNFPNENSLPSNTAFMQGDLLNGIPFPDSTFDFVHERFVIYSDLNDCQWRFLFSEMIRVLKPGGYLEIMEYRIGFDNPGPITRTRDAEVIRYLNSKGIYPDTTINSIPRIMQSSLSDFHEQDKTYPIGRWGGEFGLMMLNSFEIAQRALIKRFQPGSTEEETEHLINNMTRAPCCI